MFLCIIFTMVGIFSVFLGWLIREKKKIRLIAGVNTASQTELANMNLDAIARVVGNTCTSTGLGWIAVGGLFWAGFELALYIWIPIFIASIICVVIFVQRYDTNARSKKSTALTLVAALIPALLIMGLVGSLLFATTLEPVARVEGDAVVIDCAFGTTIQRDDISAVMWLDSLPALSRTNGGDVMGALKGQFSSKDLGRGRVYARIDAPPYILIKLRESFVIVGFRSPEDTRALYRQIEAMFAGLFPPRVAALDSAPVQNARILTLDGVRELAKKGGALTMADIEAFIGVDNLSGLYGRHIDIEGGYALQCSSGGGEGALFSAILYKRSGSVQDGIDIRQGDVDTFLKRK